MSRTHWARGLTSCAIAAALLPLAAHAGGYNEAVSGDMSNVGTSPTAVSLTLGTNEVLGTTGAVSSVVDRDYFSFTLPAGLQLSAIIVLQGTTISGSSGSFIGVQAGPQVTVSPTGGTATGLLGWTIYPAYDPTEPGVDILPQMGIASVGSSGFKPPLGSGTYAFWIQETGPGPVSYHFNFAVTAVPEPASVALWAAGLAGLVGFSRMRLRSSSQS